MSLGTFAVAAVLFLLTPTALLAHDTGPIALTIQGERLTLQTTDAPLAAILDRLAKATGVVIHCEGPTEERLSVTFTNLSVEEGLQRLLRRRNTLMIYDQHSKGPTTVYVFGPHGGAGPGTPLPVSAAVGDEEVDSAAELWKTALKVQDIEGTLRAVSTLKSPEVVAFLQNLQADPDSGVRLSALQWLVGRKELVVDALTTAFRDSDTTVQSAALQILLERGNTEQAAATVRAAAQEENEATLRQTLTTLLPQEDASASPAPLDTEE